MEKSTPLAANFTLPPALTAWTNSTSVKKMTKWQIMVFPGELWIGLDKLHQLTSARSYSLKITMTDYDGKIYTALYEQFQVNSFSVLVCKILSITLADSDKSFQWLWYFHAGWPRGRICLDSGRVQRNPLHSWRLNVPQQWEEVHHKVRFKDE